MKCPEKCECKRHTYAGAPCRDGCLCGKHYMSYEHRKRIAAGVRRFWNG